MIRLGIGSWTFPWAVSAINPENRMQPEDLVIYAAEKGLEVVQLCDNIDILSYPQDRLLKLRDLAGAHGIEIQLGGKGISRDTLLSYLKVAEIMQVRLLRTLTDTDGEKPDLDTVVALLKDISGHFESSGVTLAVENHDRYTAEEYGTIMRRVNSEYIGICFDTANSIAQVENYETCFRYMKDYIKNFHMKEFIITRIKAKMGFTVTGAQLGQGGLDVSKIVDDLRSLGRDMDIILEQWPPFLESEKQTVLQEKIWGDNGVELLKSIVSGSKAH